MAIGAQHLCVLLITLSPMAMAQQAQGAACRVIASDALRLACYDNAANQTADPGTAESPQHAESSPGTESVIRASTDGDSLIDRRWEVEPESKLGIFQMRAYKPVYILPAFWASETNDQPSSPNPNNTATEAQPLDSVEAKFQLSFKIKLLENVASDNLDIWLGYTQSSRWQAYNSDISRPFRETNYEPELIAAIRPPAFEVAGWTARLASVSLNHQSNGRSDPLSRSWNRVILSAGFDRPNWAVLIRPWFRIDEDLVDDNNPDIEDFIGRGDASIVYTKNGHELSLTGRHSLRGGDRSHGSVQLNWAFPIRRGLNGHVQVFNGYGESLIDYNHKATYVGMGVSLLEWF